MSSSDPEEVTKTASNAIEDRGFTNFVREYLIGGTILAVAYSLIEMIRSAGQTIMAPFRAMATGLAEFVEQTFGAPGRVVDAGATATVNSFIDGASASLGPAAFPVAMLSAMIGLLIFARMWARIDFSPWKFLTNR